MLPNHQPLVVAEQFGTLEALHPGRIDLGIGRAPGTDGRTARALRRAAAPGADEFPYAMIAAAVFAADTDAQAHRVALPSAIQFLRLRQGDPGLLPTPEEAAAHSLGEFERAFVEDRMGSQIIGGPDAVREQVAELVVRTGVDELMVTTAMHDGADRIRSYELLAGAIAPAAV